MSDLDFRRSVELPEWSRTSMLPITVSLGNTTPQKNINTPSIKDIISRSMDYGRYLCATANIQGHTKWNRNTIYDRVIIKSTRLITTTKNT